MTLKYKSAIISAIVICVLSLAFLSLSLKPDEQIAWPRIADPHDEHALKLNIKDRFGDGCELSETCGELIGVDCDSAADGPYYYVQKMSGRIISTCGGFCWSGNCRGCPPRAWKC